MSAVEILEVAGMLGAIFMLAVVIAIVVEGISSLLSERKDES